MTASIFLGLLSAALFAIAGALQHSVTRPMAAAATPGKAWLPVLPVILRLLRNRIWLCGLLANVLGFVVHAAALHVGSSTATPMRPLDRRLIQIPSRGSTRPNDPRGGIWIKTSMGRLRG